MSHEGGQAKQDSEPKTLKPLLPVRPATNYNLLPHLSFELFFASVGFGVVQPWATPEGCM